MMLLMGLIVLAACPKPALPPSAPTVTVGPSPATPVSHLRCEVAPEGEYQYSWWRDGLDTPYTGPGLDNGYTASHETWTCQVRAADAGADQPPLASGRVTITGADAAPVTCPNDQPGQPDVPPTIRSAPQGGWPLSLYECEGKLATSLIYLSLDGGPRPFTKYARVGRGRITELRPIDIPETLRPAHRGDPERDAGDWAYFAVWNNAGVCFRGCIEDWQFYAIQPDGLVLKLGETSIRAGMTPAYGFDDDGNFYLAERPDWQPDVDLFALEARRVLIRGAWVPRDEGTEPAETAETQPAEAQPGERWRESSVVAPEAPVAVITLQSCPGATLALPLYDPETGAPSGQHLDIAEGEDWALLGWKTAETGEALFEVKKGWQHGWTTNLKDPCASDE